MNERAGSSGTEFWGDADDTEALRHYRTLVNTIDDGIYQLDAEGHFVAVNDVITELTGYTRAELRNEHISVLLETGGSDRDREIGRRLVNPTGRSELLEFTVRTAEENQVPCEVRVNQLERDGSERGTVGVVRDITERTRGERAVGAREHRAERERPIERQRVIEALEAAREGISVLNENGDFIYVNDAYADTFGYDPEEMIGNHWETLDIENDPDRFQSEILPRIADEDQWTGTTTCLRSDGSTFPAQHSLTQTEDDELICVVRDVTDRTEREQELKRYERIVENLPVGVYRNTPGTDGEFVEGNERLASIFDADSVDELLEYNVSDLYPDPDRRAEFSRQLEREGRVEDFELKQETLTGETIWISVTAIRTEENGEVYFDGIVQDVTDRRKREQKLEARSAAMEKSIDGIAILDENERYTFVNQAHAEIYGYDDPEAFIGETWRLCYDDERLDRLEAEALPALLEDGSWRGKTIGTRKDGTTFPQELSLTVLNDGRHICIVRDVTERRAAQRELRESEAKFRMLAENLEEIVWMTTLDAEEFLYINPAFEEVWGVDREDLYDEPLYFLEGVHSDDRERIRDGFTALPEAEFDDEFRIVQPDGEVRWVHARGTRVHDEDGEMVRIVGTGEDITERKERERQLEQSERRYRTLAEHFPNGAVSVYDHDLRFTLAQGSVMGETLPSRDHIEGRTVPEVYPPDVVEDLEPLLRAAIEDGETDSAMFEFGNRHWRVWATPLRDGDHDVFAGLSFAQDVTEQVEREQRLEQLIDKLETSNERLEEFAYAASHDLQEPLRMISSYLQLIERRYADEFDADGKEFLEFAVDGADRMRNMIEGLLAYSRIETRGDAFEPVDLDVVLEEVHEDLQVKIEESDAEITTESLPRVEGDKGQLRQVFQNLLDNAIEYSGDQPPQIHISAEREVDTWTISVHDDGIGIDSDNVDRVFDVFQSLHTPADHSGMGIGLAICERIIERHGGTIWAESEAGEGSTFSVTLPSEE